MGANFYWSRVIRQDGDAYWFFPLGNLIVDRLDESPVKIFNSLDLQLQIAIMASLIACFYVYIYEIVAFLQSINSSLRLTLIVGVSKTCRSFHDDVAETGIMTDTANQIDSRDDRTSLDLRIHL